MPGIVKTNLNEFIGCLNTLTPYRTYYERAEGYEPRKRNTSLTYHPKQYDLANVSSLLHSLSFDSSFLCGLEGYALRYVIANDEGRTAYFSLEGGETGNVSAHERLAPNCLSAGMLMFEKRDGVISLTGLDHDSGYFKPEVESLIWPLKMLFATDSFNLNETLNIACREEAGCTYQLNVAALRARLTDVLPRVSAFSEKPTTCFSDSFEAYAQHVRQKQRNTQSDSQEARLALEDIALEIKGESNERVICSEDILTLSSENKAYDESAGLEEEDSSSMRLCETASALLSDSQSLFLDESLAKLKHAKNSAFVPYNSNRFFLEKPKETTQVISPSFHK